MKFLVYKPKYKKLPNGYKHVDYFLTSMALWDASFSPFMSKAIVYNTYGEAIDVSRAEINRDSQVMSVDDKTVFQMKLKGA